MLAEQISFSECVSVCEGAESVSVAIVWGAVMVWVWVFVGQAVSVLNMCGGEGVSGASGRYEMSTEWELSEYWTVAAGLGEKVVLRGVMCGECVGYQHVSTHHEYRAITEWVLSEYWVSTEWVLTWGWWSRGTGPPRPPVRSARRGTGSTPADAHTPDLRVHNEYQLNILRGNWVWNDDCGSGVFFVSVQWASTHHRDTQLLWLPYKYFWPASTTWVLGKFLASTSWLLLTPSNVLSTWITDPQRIHALRRMTLVRWTIPRHWPWIVCFLRQVECEVSSISSSSVDVTNLSPQRTHWGQFTVESVSLPTFCVFCSDPYHNTVRHWDSGPVHTGRAASREALS